MLQQLLPANGSAPCFLRGKKNRYIICMLIPADFRRGQGRYSSGDLKRARNPFYFLRNNHMETITAVFPSSSFVIATNVSPLMYAAERDRFRAACLYFRLT